VIGGFVKPGFEDVRAEFVANFERRGELGAACAAYHDGVPVVDLWGGYRDAGGEIRGGRTRSSWSTPPPRAWLR
jgi:hypothetical protein